MKRQSNLGSIRKMVSTLPVSDAVKLKLLSRSYDTLCRMTLSYINARRYIHNAKNLAENGKVAVVWGGMDCDCVSFEGSVHIVDADWRSLIAHIDSQYEGAEGPMHYKIIPLSQIEDIEYSSRDLTLEAFEDGHPYLIYK